MKNTRKARFIRFVIVGIVLYTILVSQITLAMVKPEVVEVEVIKYIEVEVEREIEEVNYWLRNIPLSEELQKFTFELCEEHGLSYDMVLAVIQHESKFNPKAVGKNNNGSEDRGLMQLNSSFHQWHSELLGIPRNQFDPFNERQNLEVGIKILAHYRDYWYERGVDDQERLFKYTLNSYNAGISAYRNMGLISRSYDRKILHYKTQLEMNGGF